MAELPQEVRVALVQARTGFSPSAERLAGLHARIRQAALDGLEPSVSSEVASARRFVGLERKTPWYLRPGTMGLGVLTLTFLAVCFLMFSVPPMGTPLLMAASQQQPAGALGVAPPRDPAPPDEPSAVVIQQSHALPATEVPASREGGSTQAPALHPPSRAKPAIVEQVAPPEDPRAPAFERRELVRPALSVLGAQQPRRARGASAANRGARAPTGDDRLAQEVSLIVGAKQALEAGDVARAELLLRDHRAAFPGGQLGSERVALEVRVHCLRNDGRQARRSFEELLLRSPKSSLRRAVERACGELLGP